MEDETAKGSNNIKLLTSHIFAQKKKKEEEEEFICKDHLTACKQPRDILSLKKESSFLGQRK